MAGLLLRLGFDQVHRVLRAHHEVREIERRQAVLAHVAQAGETVAVLAELPERLHAGVRLAPFDEGALQPAAARRPALARVDALGHLRRRAPPHGDPGYFRPPTMADVGFADGVAPLVFGAGRGCTGESGW